MSKFCLSPNLLGNTYYLALQFFIEEFLLNFILMSIIYSILSSLGLGGFDIGFLIVLVIIGLIIIVLIRIFLVLIPAILVAIVVYFLTGGDLFWTGIAFLVVAALSILCLLYTSPSPRDGLLSRMPSSA